MADLMTAVQAPANENIPALRPGDAVSVHVKIKEGTRERIQEFKGTVTLHLQERQQRHLHRSARSQQWCRCGTHFPTALPPHRQSRSGTPQCGSPRPHVLPAQPHRQERTAQTEIQRLIFI